MDNKEVSHYQSGIFMGIKAHADLGERCRKTKENDSLDRIFGNVFCEWKVYNFIEYKAILRMESITSSWRRSWEGNQSLIWCEGVPNVKLRKKWLKHGGTRRQKSTTKILQLEVEKVPSQFMLFMVWHDSMRLGKAIEQREVGIEIDIVVKIWEHYKKIRSIFGLRYVPKEHSKDQSDSMDNLSSMILDEKRMSNCCHITPKNTIISFKSWIS